MYSMVQDHLHGNWSNECQTGGAKEAHNDVIVDKMKILKRYNLTKCSNIKFVTHKLADYT